MRTTRWTSMPTIALVTVLFLVRIISSSKAIKHSAGLVLTDSYCLPREHTRKISSLLWLSFKNIIRASPSKFICVSSISDFFFSPRTENTNRRFPQIIRNTQSGYSFCLTKLGSIFIDLSWYQHWKNRKVSFMVMVTVLSRFAIVVLSVCLQVHSFYMTTINFGKSFFISSNSSPFSLFLLAHENTSSASRYNDDGLSKQQLRWLFINEPLIRWPRTAS